MAYIPSRLVGPYNLIDSYQTVYLSSTLTIIKQVILSNVTGADASVRLSLTGFNGVPGSQNAIMQDVQVEANSTLIADIVQVMQPLERLHARCSVSGAINITISGVYDSEE